MKMFKCFFVKQKTAYEMRISDWSSDVCSSDLFDRHARPGRGAARPVVGSLRPGLERRHHQQRQQDAAIHRAGQRADRIRFVGPQAGSGRSRSEEHTSELQSLMRISYAVFCLKKKKHTHKNNINKIQT